MTQPLPLVIKKLQGLRMKKMSLHLPSATVSKEKVTFLNISKCLYIYNELR
jgi:hypothetical protein